MFQRKSQENEMPGHLELIQQQMLDLREQLQQTNQRLDKFIEDATAALNLLDNDILELKEIATFSDTDTAKNISDLNKKFSDLAVIGKLVLNYNDRLKHIEFVLEKKFHSDVKKISLKKKHPGKNKKVYGLR